MIAFDSFLIHYGELSTKGDNKRAFIRQLLKNIKDALSDEKLGYRSNRDHIVVALNGEAPEPILLKLQEIAGIQRISLVYRGSRDLAELQAQALELLSKEPGKTFKCESKRADKAYPLDSYHLSCAVADYLLDHTALKVDIHHPDITLAIDVRKDAIYLSSHDYPGAGGYPLGMNGKVMLLLSGGIDSPVAGYSLLRRGVKIECIHFAAPPYTSEAVLDKLKDLLKKLNVYQADIKLNVIPFTELQLAIYKYVDEPYCITIMRRMMMRIAVGLAQKNRCLAIATGEAIGQVASQTLESMDVINAVTNFPILRPLCTSDKLQIIQTAERIGTFEISIRPYEDCCTIFKPKAPKTHPHLKDCEYFESKFDWAPLVQKCIDEAKPIYMSHGQEVFAKIQEK
jgi:tRNA uracil 4-sulfurtransferase